MPADKTRMEKSWDDPPDRPSFACACWRSAPADWNRILAEKGNIGFTLVELLVATAILALFLVVAVHLVSVMTQTYRQSGGKFEVFEAARLGMETMERVFRQATLNPYLGYDDPKAPTKYERKSDLHFFSGPASALNIHAATGGGYMPHAVFFQAPLGYSDTAALQGVNGTMCGTGFYLAYADDPNKAGLPARGRLPVRNRFRLMQFLSPAETLEVGKYTIKNETADGQTFPVGNAAWDATDWFSTAVSSGNCCHVLAENVVAFAVLPVVNGEPAASYLYNSRDKSSPDALNQLPQALKVVMAVIDEASAIRLDASGRAQSLLTGNLFSDSSSFDADVASLDRQLALHKPPLNYRIFVSEVPIQAAQWSL